MLTKITLENFKVFKERTEIDFRKTNYAFLPENVAENGVLKGAVFVGANASGKSSVLEAIKVLLKLLFGEHSYDGNFYMSFLPPGSSPFMAPVTLKYDFLINDEKISYQFTSGSNSDIQHEQLLLNGDLFMERSKKSAWSKIADPKGIEYSESDVAYDVLFLRTLYFNTKFQGNDLLQQWFSFLSDSIYVHQIDSDFSFYVNPQEGDIYQYLERTGTNRFNNFFKEYNFKQRIEVKINRGGMNSFGQKIKPEIMFSRELTHGSTYALPESLESTGNRALLRLLHMFFVALSRPCLLVIDEFSSGLHNELEELLIKYFMKHSSQSQLFLVTHSTNLLDNTILRPDQEYAVQFTPTGSVVTRFSSEKPRLAQNVEKMYLSGVFGGLPKFNDPQPDEDQP